jgi:hypothetical protein
VLGILMLVGLALTGCTSQATSKFDRWYEDYAKTVVECEARAQYWAGRESPQKVANRCRASHAPVSFPSKDPRELPALP